MRVLIVSPFIPSPPTEGGRIRVLNLIKHLAQLCQVTLLAPKTPNSTERDAELIRGMGVELIVADEGPGIGVKGLGLIASGHPIPLSKYRLPGFAAKLRELLERERFDVIEFDMLHAGQYLPLLRRSSLNRSTPAVLVEHNIDSFLWLRVFRAARSPWRKAGALLQAAELREIERKLCPQFDLCVCVSEEDARRLKRIAPGAKVEVVPNGVDTGFFSPMKREVEPERMVYVGSMDWYPNEDAVVYFCDRILPLIRREVPEAELLIVGQSPTERVRRLGRMRGIYVTGTVEDVRPYVASSAVFIVPLRVGGGTRLKILEALSMGKAVVSTSIGAEGLDLRPGVDLIVEDDPAGFAEAVVKLMRDERERERLGRNGRERVIERYGWDKMASKLFDLFNRLAR
ncbi:hypothetical protein DRP77_11870 [Candidatus Poribacteria bacterium]|nr:MAG: hypothetical protein DRP77_11870 [Candidatus Poribacteria bacterium]